MPGFAVPLICKTPPKLQAFTALAELRGTGARIIKSSALLSVSVQPLLLRRAPVALFRLAVFAPSKHKAASP